MDCLTLYPGAVFLNDISQLETRDAFIGKEM